MLGINCYDVSIIEKTLALPFGSTYKCEQILIQMKLILSKTRNSFTIENSNVFDLKQRLFKLNLAKLTSQVQHQRGIDILEKVNKLSLFNYIWNNLINGMYQIIYKNAILTRQYL